MNTQLIEQAVINLLDNAVNYSPYDSKVIIKAGKNQNETIISVIDNGPGIEQKHLPRLFESFYRIDKARSRGMGGTGLGLALVKHIALSHNGKATVQSTVGKGSCFSIILPN